MYARYGPSRQFDVAAPHLSGQRAEIPLPPFGTLGIDPSLMVALPLVAIPQPAGVGTLMFGIPNLPHLHGVPFYAQALLLQHPVAAHLTNVAGEAYLR